MTPVQESIARGANQGLFYYYQGTNYPKIYEPNKI